MYGDAGNDKHHTNKLDRGGVLAEHENPNGSRGGREQREHQGERRPRQPRHSQLVAHVGNHGGTDTNPDASQE